MKIMRMGMEMWQRNEEDGGINKGTRVIKYWTPSCNGHNVENRVGGAENQVGCTENWVGGAESQVGGAENRVGGAENWVGGAENQVGGAKN